MAAATAAEWLTAAAIGTGVFPLFAAAVYAAHLDVQLPHVPWDKARDAAEQAAQRARLQLAAWLMVLAYHLEQPQGGTR
jgi:hypothetical protein